MDLTREEGLKPPKLEVSEPFTLPKSGLVMRVRELTVAERRALDAVRWKVDKDDAGEPALVIDNEKEDAAWIVWCACDAAGARIFKTEDLTAISKWHASDAIFAARKAAELNRLGKESVEAEVKN